MTRQVRSRLDALVESYELGDQLHDVSPNVVYEATVEGEPVVCKVSTDPRGDAGVEGRVQRYVDEESALPVPPVVAVGDDAFVATYCEDAPEVPEDGSGVADAEWLQTAGRGLARLHETGGFDRPGRLAVGRDVDGRLVVEADEDATWSDALDDLLATYHDQVRGSGYGDVVADAREFVAAHADRFDVLGDRDPALVHGWFTPEHVAVEDGEVTCVLDFEHALVGSGEWDFWRAAVPLFFGDGWTTPEDGLQWFREHYESVRPFPPGFDDRALAYRTLVTVSYFDSLATQRGIYEDTREEAEFLRERVETNLSKLREQWS